jgi:UDP-N-acetylmuramoylalanine--D-glutamate ligase
MMKAFVRRAPFNVIRKMGFSSFLFEEKHIVKLYGRSSGRPDVGKVVEVTRAKWTERADACPRRALKARTTISPMSRQAVSSAVIDANDLIMLAGRRVTILGAGRTGLALARFLTAQGACVYLSECGALLPGTAHELEDLDVEYEQGGHSKRALAQAELIIPSPGIPSDVPILQSARRREVPIVGELELAYRFCSSDRIIAVTGSVGKTTTVHLIEQLLSANAHRVIRAGNEAKPFVAMLPEITPGTIVLLEVSSFQLETVESFRPHIAVFTRFVPNHLDRHRSLEAYFALKCRIFENQTEHDYALVHREIELPYGLHPRLIRFDGSELVGSEYPTLLPHQRADLAAAWLACRALEPSMQLEKLDLGRALALPHRVEFVAAIDGVNFYDDSKATCVAATLAALQGFSSSTLLILGGRTKGEDFSPLARAIRNRDLQGALLIGESAPLFARALSAVDYRRFQCVDSLRRAVEIALEMRPENCLLSPACASFDQFRSYQERGRSFQEIVRGRIRPRPLLSA